MVKRIFVVPTVMHSGTHFTFSLFGSLGRWTISGIDTIDDDFKQTPDDVNHVLFYHMLDQVMDTIEKVMDKYPSVIPLRHPARIYESWYRRIGVRMWADPEKDNLNKQMRNLINIADKYDPTYILIDSDKKDRWLERANNRLDVEFKTDWSVNHSNFGAARIPVTKEMEDRVPEFVNNFYHEKIYQIESEL